MGGGTPVHTRRRLRALTKARPPAATALRLPAAARALRRGGIVAYPTEGVIGIGCNAFDTVAVTRLLASKRRSPSKGLIVLFAEISQVRALLEPLPTARRREVTSSWPGPVTWLLPAPGWIPRLLCGGSRKIAVRVTAHPVARALCQAFGGALTSTSANRSGAAPLPDTAAVRRVFGADIDVIVPGSAPCHGQPTAVIDALSGAVLRPGPAYPRGMSGAD